MKYIILTLFTSFLLTPCFAQEGYGNYYANALSALKAKESVPVEYLNGFVVVSRLNNFYALPVQVKDKQNVLQQSQVQFLLNSMEADKMAWGVGEDFTKLERQAVVMDAPYHNSYNALKEAEVIAKAHIPNNETQQSWDEIVAIVKQDEVDGYNFVSHFSDEMKEGSSIKNGTMYAGPNGGGGAYERVAVYQNVNPKDIYYWQMAGNIETIESGWGKAYEISREEFLDSIMGGQVIEAQHYKVMLNSITLDNYKDFGMNYEDNMGLKIKVSNSLSSSNNIWNNASIGANMLQGMEGRQKAISALNSFFNEIQPHNFMDGTVYVIGPNGGGGAYMIQNIK